MPTPKEIEKRVIASISKQMSCPEDEVTRNTSFLNDLNADSLDILELAMELDEEFQISIDDEEFEMIHTVGQAIDLITQYVDDKAKE